MRPFSYKTTKLDDITIPFYSRIGLLSVRFSEIESLVTHILEKLINSDNDLISSMLVEKNNLDRNLNILKQINNTRGYEEEKISQIVSDINSLKDIRNFFIHGVWSEVQEKKDQQFIYCSNHKHQHEKHSHGHTWIRYDSEKFTLDDLENNIIKADEILLDLKFHWENLQEIDFY